MSAPLQHAPVLSLVVVCYNIARQLKRTLVSLSADHQRYIAKDDYEVIVVDNGSTPPLDAAVLDGLNGAFRLVHVNPAPPSPAHAINVGLAEARGQVIGVMVDGARIATPGFLHFAVRGAQLYERAVVATLGWHLGCDSSQRLAMEAGYDPEREEALLQSIAWPEDGYRLFEIAALDQSTCSGWFTVLGETNALFLPRRTWDELGGADERFDAPGGGLNNHDLYDRALRLPGAELVVLLGEATFHQMHGGVSSSADVRTFGETFRKWREQYEAIRGRRWTSAPAEARRTLLGTLPRPALMHFVRGALYPVRPVPGSKEPPLGDGFDSSVWSLKQTTEPADPVTRELTRLALEEFRAGRFTAAAAVARVARERDPDEPEPQRLLAMTSIWLPTLEPPTEHRVETLLALADARCIAGDPEGAARLYRDALAIEPNLVRAHNALARLRMPGDDYLTWLQRLHRALKPDTYVEIGVSTGNSLALAEPPTLAIGIDPEPMAGSTLKADTYLCAGTSDDFFSRDGARALAGHTVKLAFVDGLHTFEQSLRDFINLEAHCGDRSVILLHDTVPLDEPTQRRERVATFWTGDVWKIVVALRTYRPDLDVFTIATQPTGLTVVTRLDPASRVLAERFDEVLGAVMPLRFEDVLGRLDETLNMVPNDWPLVAARLSGALTT